jgi:hypothetical protein
VESTHLFVTYTMKSTKIMSDHCVSGRLRSACGTFASVTVLYYSTRPLSLRNNSPHSLLESPLQMCGLGSTMTQWLSQNVRRVRRTRKAFDLLGPFGPTGISSWFGKWVSMCR